METLSSLDMQLYEYAKELAESRLQAEQAGVAALRTYRQTHPARRKRRGRRRRRLQPTHSAPASPHQKQSLDRLRDRVAKKPVKVHLRPPAETPGVATESYYVEGPLC
jgi:hypothetical protein